MKIKRAISFITASLLTICCFSNGYVHAESDVQPGVSELTDEIKIASTNSFGSLISDEISANQQEMIENNGCNIFSIEFDGAKAHAEFETTAACTILVGIYDESGETMLASGSREITPDETQVDIVIETDHMPEYFYVRGFLVDTDTLAPICTEYDSPNYTQEMQEFLSKDIFDFDQDLVLNLDNDTQNNFAVFNESAVISQSSENVNTVVSADDENGIYALENIDESVLNLQEGDIFSCEYGENQILIAKVSDIEINGTSAVINSEDTSLDEVFDYVKIDSGSDLSSAKIDYDAMDDGIECTNAFPELSPNNKNAYDKDTSLEAKVNLNIASKKIGKITLSGSLSFGVAASLKTYISLKYQYFELRIDGVLGFDISLSGSLSSPAILKLPAVDFSPVPGVYIGLQPKIQVKCSGKLSFGGKITTTVGFCYDSDAGFKNLTSKPTVGDMEFSAQASIFVGLVLEPRVYIASDKVAKASLEGLAGVEISGKLTKKIGDYDSTHECDYCIDGDITAKMSLSCSLSFMNMKKLTWEHNFNTWSYKLKDFYFSIDKKEFGWGNCPYNKHTVFVKVLSKPNDYPISRAKVTCGGVEGVSNSDGVAELLLSDGIYTMTVNCDNCKPLKKLVVVCGRDKTLTVRPTVIDPAQSSTTTAVAPGTSAPTVTTTTIALDQPDENGEFTHNGVVYKCYDDHAEVSGHIYYQLPDNLVLLKEVCGLPVTVIGDEAFDGAFDYPPFQDNKTSITIPDSVTSIGYGAFRGCTDLTSITIPDSVTDIGKSAFWRCSNITTITISDSVTSIKANTFYGCSNLTSITIPNSVTSIGSYAFEYCSSLTSITIPNGVTKIQAFTFYNCTSLTSIIIPKSVTNIQYNAFCNCSDLTDVYYSGTEEEWNNISISISENDKLLNATIHYNSIGSDQSDENGEFTHNGVVYKCYDDHAVVYCTTGLPSDVTLLSEVCGLPVTDIGDWAFYNSVDLTSIIIPNSVTSIGINAFCHCYSLTSITIPNSVTSIGDEAFDYCSSLTSIIIPKSVTLIQNDVFRNCSDLTDVYYPGTEEEWNNISIDSDNITLLNVTIHYNSVAPAAYSLTPESPVVLADEQTASAFSGLIPGGLYNFYEFADRNAESLLSAENLLYAIQFTADENGNAELPYIPNGDDQTLIIGAMHSIENAEISVGDIDYTGSQTVAEPVITWNGIRLTEGRDYELEGDLSASKPGSYKLMVEGIGEFFGYAEVKYDVVCKHKFTDGICSVCGEKDPNYVPVPIENINYGDVDDNGTIDALDASLVLIAYSMKATGRPSNLDEQHLIAADVNKDGNVDALDASSILIYYSAVATGKTPSWT